MPEVVLAVKLGRSGVGPTVLKRLWGCGENHDLHGAVLAGRHNHPARFWIVAHRFCACFCGDFLDRGILVWRILMEDEHL